MPTTIGYVGLDTSHVVAFTQLLNDPNHAHHIPGAKVVAGFPGGSPDMPMSANRVAGYVEDLKTKHNIAIMESPEEVAKASDLVFIMSIDGRQHLEQLRRTLPFKRPTFMDKPFATTSADAKEMFSLAREANIPLMSCSALRYADNLSALLKASSEPIVGVDVFGPMNVLPEPPGLFWYGIHSIEILVSVLGPGWKQVQTIHNDNTDLVTITWQPAPGGSVDRIVTFRGNRNAHHQFGITVQREKSVQHADLSNNPRPLYAGMLEAILNNLPQGKSAIPEQETLEIVEILEAANQSRASGKVVAKA
jgi:predicted dehydrogenase